MARSVYIPYFPVVQCWTMNNYHWYLKQSIEFDKPIQLPVCVLWDVIDPAMLYILLSDGSISRYILDWVTAANTHTGSSHEVAVIDGCKYLQAIKSLLLAYHQNMLRLLCACPSSVHLFYSMYLVCLYE